MPLFSFMNANVYPEKALEESGYTRKDLEYYDSFMKILREYKGDRKKLISGNGSQLFSSLESQYERLYCDFKNKKYDYNTDIYRKIYSYLDDWERSPQFNDFYVSPYFTELPSSIFVDDYLNADEILMNMRFGFTSYARDTVGSEFHSVDFEYNINDWRAVHWPYLSEDVNENSVNVIFAYINPYSKNKKNAEAALEYFAENYFEAIDIGCHFLLKDKSAYPESYYTDSRLFNDFYEIAANSFIPDMEPQFLRDDIDDFQRGKCTMDEAIATYSRAVEMWLNE